MGTGKATAPYRKNSLKEKSLLQEIRGTQLLLGGRRAQEVFWNSGGMVTVYADYLLY
jgi:hypothetical protein